MTNTKPKEFITIMTLDQYLHKTVPKDWLIPSSTPSHSAPTYPTATTPMIISYRLYASYDDVALTQSSSQSLSLPSAAGVQPYDRNFSINKPPRHSTPVLRGRAPYPLLSDQLKRANFAYTYVEDTTGRLIFVCYLD